MFAGIQRYMDEAQEGLTTAQSIEIVQKLLHQGLKRPELKDELFMQLLKQSRGNPSPQAAGVLITLAVLMSMLLVLQQPGEVEAEVVAILWVISWSQQQL